MHKSDMFTDLTSPYKKTPPHMKAYSSGFCCRNDFISGQFNRPPQRSTAGTVWFMPRFGKSVGAVPRVAESRRTPTSVMHSDSFTPFPFKPMCPKVNRGKLKKGKHTRGDWSRRCLFALSLSLIGMDKILLGVYINYTFFIF